MTVLVFNLIYLFKRFNLNLESTREKKQKMFNLRGWHKEKSYQMALSLGDVVSYKNRESNSRDRKKDDEIRNGNGFSSRRILRNGVRVAARLGRSLSYVARWSETVESRP